MMRPQLGLCHPLSQRNDVGHQTEEVGIGNWLLPHHSFHRKFKPGHLCTEEMALKLE